jgi:hypothetical protein
MAFKGRDLVRSQILIDNQIIEHNKIITGIINNAFRPQKPSKKTRIELHNTLALTALFCGGEN